MKQIPLKAVLRNIYIKPSVEAAVVLELVLHTIPILTKQNQHISDKVLKGYNSLTLRLLIKIPLFHVVFP